MTMPTTILMMDMVFFYMQEMSPGLKEMLLTQIFYDTSNGKRQRRDKKIENRVEIESVTKGAATKWMRQNVANAYLQSAHIHALRVHKKRRASGRDNDLFVWKRYTITPAPQNRVLRTRRQPAQGLPQTKMKKSIS